MLVVAMRSGVLWLSLMGGCQSVAAPLGPEEGGRRDVPAVQVEPVAAVPEPPEPALSAAPVDSLDDLRKRFGALDGYRALPKMDREAWRASVAGKRLWVRANGDCVLLEPRDDGDSWYGEVPACRLEDAGGTTTCSSTARVRDGGFDVEQGVSCARRNADGTGRMGGGSHRVGVEVMRPLSTQKARTTFAYLHVARVDSGATVVDQPCRDGSAARAVAERRARHPTETEEELSDALRVSHGITPGASKRRCRRVEGPTVYVSPDQPRYGNHGVALHIVEVDEPADCASPCPNREAWQEVRALAERLSGFRFVARDDERRVDVHRSLASCQADADGLVIQNEQACRDY